MNQSQIKQKSMKYDVLLDSSYLLPTFGIQVEGITNEDLLSLRKIWLNGLVNFYCLSVSWIEILGKVCRESHKIKVNLEDTVRTASLSVTESGVYKWINPPSEALSIAYTLCVKGHKDMIDNLLYATSVVYDMIFLTMDSTLKDFLARNDFLTENVMTHRELFKLLGIV